MNRPTFDLDALRSFQAGIELGSFARAAERLGRSTSAVSAQLKKLEDQVGTPLVRKAGRGVALTSAGETLMAYARRLLDLNDEAALAVRETELEGWVRLGLQEDFGDLLLPQMLVRFARAHPKVKIEARVARNDDLLERIAAGTLDLALAWGDGSETAHAQVLGRVPMRWVAAADRVPARYGAGAEPLPLVAFDPPCVFRAAGTTALERAAIPWRSAFSSPNLGGLWAAVGAGLGLTIRTGIGLPERVAALAPGQDGLPRLPSLAMALHRATPVLAPPAARLADIVTQAVREAGGP